MAASSLPLHFEAVRSPLTRNRSILGWKTPSIFHLSTRTTSAAATPSAKFNLSEILGGRGICNGEQGLGKELDRSVVGEPESLPPDPAIAADFKSPSPSLSVGGEEGFDKELMGLTGGFPGGELGLQRFVERNPPPEKKSDGWGEVSGILLQGSKPKPPEIPLLMPGMTVIVKNQNNPFYMYSGVVQRITDGKAGVLFEGGNWDKLLTFRLPELERREKGPPMVNPKSAILEPLVDTKPE
uniref:Chlororespiratory reduction31 n=1 Tax=Habenaria pantlingiana TaxID=1498489 RepID=A0A0F7GZW9_9ASPA